MGGRTGAAGLRQHADEHRPERPILLAVDQEFGEGPSVAPVDEIHALPPEDRLGASGRRDDGRLIQVQDDAEPVGPALAPKPPGIPVDFRLRVSQVLGRPRGSLECPLPATTTNRNLADVIVSLDPSGQTPAACRPAPPEASCHPKSSISPFLKKKK